MDLSSWLEAAYAIADNLVGTAQRTEHGCSWNVRQDRSDGTVHSVGPTLYSGNSGIALFLSEASRCLEEPRFGSCAADALRQAIFEAKSTYRERLGLHDGVAGVVWALDRHRRIRGSDELDADMGDLLTLLEKLIPLDRTHDVIGGNAGVVLMAMALEGDDARRLDLAARAGERLVALARMEAIGWSWDPHSSLVVERNLTGFGHGASGIGLALLKLALELDRGDFLYGAQMAFAYEDRFFDREHANWPDFRNRRAGEILWAGGQDAVWRAIDAGEDLQWVPSYSMAWCHGAPGMVLARWAARRILTTGPWSVPLEATLHRVLTATARMSNSSLCHGALGNLDVLWTVSSDTQDGELREGVQRQVQELTDRHAARGDWPSGNPNVSDDPSLMLGKAGVGYQLLRMCRPSVPSVLLPGLPEQSPAHSRVCDHTRYREQAARHLLTFFSSLEAEAPRLCADLLPWSSDPQPNPSRLARRASAHGSSKRHLLPGEQRGWDLSQARGDYSGIAARTRLHRFASESDRMLVQRVENTTMRRDTSTDAQALCAVTLRRGQPSWRELTRLESAIVSTATQPTTVEQIRSTIRRSPGLEDADPARIDLAVGRAMERLVHEGILDTTETNEG